MAAIQLEDRVAVLEREVERLKLRMEDAAPCPQLWWERVFGAFADAPVFDEAMRLGREYRKSLRPAEGDAQDGQDVPA